MKVAVTGANGFLGSHIVRLLVKKGCQVTSLVRNNSSTTFLGKNAGKIVKINYQDKNRLKEIFNDIDFLIHNAAVSKDWGRYQDFEDINVGLTQNVISAAIQSKVKNIIYISSNSVLGEEDCRDAKKEDAPYKPKINYLLESMFPSGMNHYKITKALGEKKAVELSDKKDINLTVLRPVWIFGPREFHAGPYEYCKTVKDGIPVMPGTKNNLFHTVYVEDVARAVYQVIKKEPQKINIYNIGPMKVQSMHHFYGKFCKNLKRRKPVNLPKVLLDLPVSLMEFFYIIMKIKTPPLLTRARLYMMYASNVYDVTKAKRELDFEADTDIDYAIRKTVKWWKLNKFL